jgi:hypothetical protein
MAVNIIQGALAQISNVLIKVIKQHARKIGNAFTLVNHVVRLCRALNILKIAPLDNIAK